MAVEVPILRIEDYLLATVQVALSDEDLLQFGEDLCRAVVRHRVGAAIIDVSALDVIDSFAARQLRNVANRTRLRGARTVLVGIQPDVAYGMVQLGLELQGVDTVLDLDDALAMLRRRGPR